MLRVVIRGRAGWAVTNGRRTGGCLAHNSPPPVMGNVFAVLAPPGQYLAELWLLPLPFSYSAGVVLSDSTYCVTWGLVRETNASLHCYGTFSGSPHNALHSLVLHYIILHYIIYWCGFTLVFCNLHCIQFCIYIHYILYIYIIFECACAAYKTSTRDCSP